MSDESLPGPRVRLRLADRRSGETGGTYATLTTPTRKYQAAIDAAFAKLILAHFARPDDTIERAVKGLALFGLGLEPRITSKA